MRNAQIEDKDTSTRSKRRRSQTTQSFTIDAVRRGQSKRSRAFDSREASEQRLEISNPKRGSEQLERSISSNHEGTFATDIATLNQDIESIPQVVPEVVRKRTRPTSEEPPALASKVNRSESEKPPSRRNIQDQVRAMLTGDGNEGKVKVYHPE